MNKEEFWQTIESVNHLVPDGNQEAVEEKMCEELLHHSPQDILDWYIIFHEYLNAAYRNDLWAACTALGAHASDDGFIDFRAWLISQGKKVYMDAMRDPDTLAQNPHPGVEMNFEGFTYCPVDAYEKNPSSLGLRRKFRLYDDLDNHKLSEQVIKDIREEIPQRKDIPSNRLPVDYSSLFPHIWERMTGQKPQEAPEGDGLMTVHRMLDGTYQLHRTEVPDRLFEGAPPNILEYLEYALYFGAESPSSRAHQQFVDCFVTYEERTRPLDSTDSEDESAGEPEEETYTVAIPITDIATIWSNIQTALGETVAEEQRNNADSIYNLVRYGSATGTEGWIPGAEVPFIGADGFCSPVGSSWESRVTSEFGYRSDPFTGQTKGHTGIDIAVPTGTPVRAALPGVVTKATYNAGGYGYYVMIDHGNGMVTLYAHNSKLLVSVGDTVEAGDTVSLSGSTGRSTGPHLHFEVRVNGQRVNPRSYLPTN